ADPVEQLGAASGVEFAAGHRALGGVFDVSPAPGDALGVELDGDHPQAGPGHHLGDPGSHGAEPDDADRAELPCHVCHLASHRRSKSYASVTCGDGRTADGPLRVSFTTGSCKKPDRYLLEWK